MEIFLTFVKVFVVGGLFCVVGQLLLAKTMLTTGRILAIFVVAGVVLTAVGLYEPLVEFADVYKRQQNTPIPRFPRYRWPALRCRP